MAFLDNFYEKNIFVEGEIFSEVGFGNWTGFYDWLRTSEGFVIGVRYTPFERLLLDSASILALPYVAVDSTEWRLEILFSKRRDWVEEMSDDQAFIHNAVFRSAKGEFALSFDLSNRTENELAAIRALNVNWLDVKWV